MSPYLVGIQGHTRFEHDDTGDFFTESFVGKSEYCAFMDLREFVNRRLNFGTVDVLAST